jgi:hypothetical protein
MRWLTRDPVSYDGGANLYEYVRGRPVHAVDPDGKQAQAIGAGTLLGGGGESVGASIVAGAGAGLGLGGMGLGLGAAGICFISPAACERLLLNCKLIDEPAFPPDNEDERTKRRYVCGIEYYNELKTHKVWSKKLDV